MEKSIIIKEKRLHMDRINQLIISNYSKFTDSDQYIAKTVLNNPELIESATIEELANICSVSKSTIVRFSRKIGLEGFSELKLLIKMGREKTPVSESDFIARVSESDIQLINYYREYDFEPILKMMDKSKTIYAYGTGRFQQSFSQEMQRLFMHIGIWIRLIEGPGEFETATSMMKENDLLIVVSSKGENKLLKKYYNLLHVKGINILSFTNSANNSLVFASNYNITTELNKEKIEDLYYFDNIVSMYIPLKIFYAQYINHQIKKS